MPSPVLNCAIYIEVVHWKGKMLLKVSNLRPSPYISPPLVTLVDTTYTHFSMLGSDKADKHLFTCLGFLQFLSILKDKN